MSRRAWLVAASAAVAAGSLLASDAFAAIAVEVVSSRPELVTGGDALLKVTGATTPPTITVDGKDASVAFKPDAKGAFVGLLAARGVTYVPQLLPASDYQAILDRRGAMGRGHGWGRGRG